MFSSFSLRRKRLRYRASGLIIALLLLAAGCSAGDRIERARKATGEFRVRLDSGNLRTIYAEASAEFRQASELEKFERFLQTHRERLGRVKASSEENFNIHFAPGATTVTLYMNATYEKGEAKETFIWRVGRERTELMGYDIRSDAFVFGSD